MRTRTRRLLLPVVALALAIGAFGAAPPALGETPLSPVVQQPVRPDWFGGQLSHRVFGYLPYWEMTSGVERYLRYDLLSTIAFFGLPINTNGGISTTSPGYKAWMSPRATRITSAAHAAGVRTEITFTSFGYDRNAEFFGDARHRAAFVRNAVRLMQERGADGANLDVELITNHYYASFGALVRELKAAATRVNPNAQVSVATNANTSGARMASIAVANGADQVFVMGYDYRWSGSTQSGAIDPIVSASGGLSLSKSIELYRHYGVPLDHVVLGVGYYGRSYPTASRRLRAPVQTDSTRFGSSSVFFPSSLPASSRGTTFMYDRVEQAARLLRWDASRGTWIQTYYNDPRTLAARLDLTMERKLAGMGIWALGYDEGQPGYWQAIADAYTVPPPSVSITPLLMDASPSTGGANSPAGGNPAGGMPTGVNPAGGIPTGGNPAGGQPSAGSNATRSIFVTVGVTSRGRTSAPTELSLSNDGTSWSSWMPLGGPVPWTLIPGPDGNRTVHVQLRDSTGAVLSLSQQVVLDTASPVVSAPAAALPGRARAGLVAAPVQVQWSADDPSGIARYRLEMSANGGDWVTQKLYSPPPRTTRSAWRPAPTASVSVPSMGPATHPCPWKARRSASGSSRTRRVPCTSRPAGSTSRRRLSRAATRRRRSGAARPRPSISPAPEIAVLGSVGPGRGGATVTVDGVVGSFNAYARTGSSRRVLYSKTLAAGRHTVVVRVYGTSGRPTIDLDSFVVIG